MVLGYKQIRLKGFLKTMTAWNTRRAAWCLKRSTVVLIGQKVQN
jgi:hypothetical protein